MGLLNNQLFQKWFGGGALERFGANRLAGLQMVMLGRHKPPEVLQLLKQVRRERVSLLTGFKPTSSTRWPRLRPIFRAISPKWECIREPRQSCSALPKEISRCTCSTHARVCRRHRPRTVPYTLSISTLAPLNRCKST